MAEAGNRARLTDPASLLAVFLVLFLLASMVSISASQVGLGLAVVCWLVLLAQRKVRSPFPAFFWPLAVYIGLSVVSAVRSVDPPTSFKDSRDLLLFLIVPVVYSGLRRTQDIRRANLALFASGAASILYSLGYQALKASPGERSTGFMGHYMTQAGILLLFITLAMAVVFLSREKTKILWAAALLLALVAVVLTMTRSAWVGIVVAAAVIVFLARPKALVILPLLIGLALLVAPKNVRTRALSVFSPGNAWNAERVEYLKAGLKIIGDYPLFGTGPDTVDVVFKQPRYGLSETAKRNVHLHNNLIQIGAERGLPALAAWLAFLVWAAAALVGEIRRKNPMTLAAAAAGLAALLASFAAGLFEYNFGDSEVNSLLLYLITVPLAMSRAARAWPGEDGDG